jgi:hypothetical protein
VPAGETAEEAILGCHAAIWLTAYPVALGHEERELLAGLAPVLPKLRAIILADRGLLARLSDDPDREADDVRARVRALMPSWEVLDEGASLSAVGAKNGSIFLITSRRRHPVR